MRMTIRLGHQCGEQALCACTSPPIPLGDGTLSLTSSLWVQTGMSICCVSGSTYALDLRRLLTQATDIAMGIGQLHRVVVFTGWKNMFIREAQCNQLGSFRYFDFFVNSFYRLLFHLLTKNCMRISTRAISTKLHLLTMKAIISSNRIVYILMSLF